MVQFEVQLFGTVTRFVSHEMLIFNGKSFTVSIIGCLFAYTVESAVLKTTFKFQAKKQNQRMKNKKTKKIVFKK